MKLSKKEIRLLQTRLTHDIQRIEEQAYKTPENAKLQTFYNNAVRTRQTIIYKLKEQLKHADS